MPFGVVGPTFFKSAGFSLREVNDVSAALFGLRISVKEAGSRPWTERVYELVAPVLPEKSVLEKVKDVRFVYFEDGSARMHLLGDDRVVLGEIQMKLKETISSEAVGK